jgi:hypothetical protein
MEVAFAKEPNRDLRHTFDSAAFLWLFDFSLWPTARQCMIMVLYIAPVTCLYRNARPNLFYCDFDHLSCRIADHMPRAPAYSSL